MANNQFYEISSSFASKLHLKYLIQLVVKSNGIDLRGSWSLCFATAASSPALFSKHPVQHYLVNIVMKALLCNLWFGQTKSFPYSTQRFHEVL